MKKQIATIFIMSLLTLSAFGQKEIELIDKTENKYAYRDRFEISLPAGYYFNSSIIYNSDSAKVGEVAFDYDKLIEPISNVEFLDAIRKGDVRILTDDIGYTTGCYDCTEIKSGLLTIGSKEWIYQVNETYYEGDGEYGSWNSFKFADINENCLLLIFFYNKNLKELELDSYVKILETVKKK